MGGQGRQLSCCSYLWGDSAAGIAVARWMAGWDPCSAAGGLSKDSGGGQWRQLRCCPCLRRNLRAAGSTLLAADRLQHGFIQVT